MHDLAATLVVEDHPASQMHLRMQAKLQRRKLKINELAQELDGIKIIIELLNINICGVDTGLHQACCFFKRRSPRGSPESRATGNRRVPTARAVLFHSVQRHRRHFANTRMAMALSAMTRSPPVALGMARIQLQSTCKGTHS